MKFIYKLSPFFVLVILILLIFKSWFLFGLIAGGDFQVYYPEMFVNFSYFPPPSWNFVLGAGLGVNGASLLWNYVVVQFPIVILGNLLGLNWELVQRVGYLYPYLALSILIPFFFLKKLFSSTFAVLGLLIFSFNTYILMLVGGGQIFLSLAYVLIPPVFYFFYKLINGSKASFDIKSRIFCACVLVFSLQVLFDVRIAYVTLFAVLIYSLTGILFFGKGLKNLNTFPLVLIATGLLHFFWLLPTLLLRQNPLSSFGAEYISSNIVKFFSFAKFENTISLLQPNWPENIFGKAYFMRPEFLILSILAFSSLLFIKREKKEKRELILFLSLLAIIGAFLAKGTGDPFGGLYLLLFERVPGFIMFRDPTKWYPLVAISYSVLIPYTLLKIATRVSSIQYRVLSKKHWIQNTEYTILFIFFVYFLFLIRPAWMGQLGGIFKTTKIPADYIKLEQFLANDKNFYRTFWLPKTSTFSFYSANHPIVTGFDFVRAYSSREVINKLKDKNYEKVLSEISVKYVIVPSDTEKKIFLKDRKYYAKEYEVTLKNLRKISYLKEIGVFGKIAVFELSKTNDHFWSPSQDLEIKYKFINPSKYLVSVEQARKGDILVFSENFDRYWEARNTSIQYSVSSIQYPVSKDRALNSFVLPKDGSYSFEVYYKSQDWVNIGLVVSGITLGSIIIILIRSKFKK